MSRFTDFVKEHAKDKGMTYHCALCNIQKNSLYVKKVKLTKGQQSVAEKIKAKKEMRSKPSPSPSPSPMFKERGSFLKSLKGLSRRKATFV